MRCYILIAIYLFAGVTFAAPITLKCIDQSGRSTVDLKVDITKREMQWGISKYEITQIDEKFISGILASDRDRVGGEIWVLNRITGKYDRASVAILSTQLNDGSLVDPKLQASTYSGTCKAAVL